MPLAGLCLLLPKLPTSSSCWVSRESQNPTGSYTLTLYLRHLVMSFFSRGSILIVLTQQLASQCENGEAPQDPHRLRRDGRERPCSFLRDLASGSQKSAAISRKLLQASALNLQTLSFTQPFDP